MKVLFDENVPHKLQRNLTRHNVHTVTDMGWVGIKNGDLLKLAQGEDFDVLVTCDQNLTYQQNLRGQRIALIVLDTNNWNVLKLRPELATQAVDAASPGSFRTVEYKLRPARKR